MNKNMSREEILSIAKEKGIKISFLNDLIGGYRGKLTDWKNGKTSLTETELSTITNYLLGKEAFKLSDQALDVATKFDQLSDDNQSAIIKIINRFYNENN